MVRITSRSFLHLTPEMVGLDVEHPFYVKIVKLGSDTVEFRSLEGGEGTVDRSVAEQQVVLASEVTRSRQMSLLRRPVSVKVAEDVHFGQVVRVDNEFATIQSGEHQFVGTVDAVAVVAPVVALLLQDVGFNSDEWSPSEIDEVGQSILDRVLGRGGASASNKIGDIFNGLLSEESYPPSTKVCRWIDPKTGDQTQFLLQHAIDFAYHVDGGVAPVPASVGLSFCRPPLSPSPRSTSGLSRRSVRDVQELFDPFTDDDNAALDDTESADVVAGVAAATPGSQKKRPAPGIPAVQGASIPQAKRHRSRTALDQDTLIMAKIGDEPDLLDRFLAIRNEAKAKRQDEESCERGRASASEAQHSPPAKRAKPTSKYAFAPSDDQVQVHDQVTAQKHKGKSANLFCKSLVRSEYVEFKALPGVCTRAYDIRFGSGGLSIRHFARLTRDERVAWLGAGGSNFDNLSATAEFSSAIPATRIDEVVDASRVFLTYAREFCCAELIKLVECIVKFVEHTLSQVVWTPKELPSLVYWINDVLEDFRAAAEEGGDLRSVLQRCNTDDRLLRDVMFLKVHRQVDDVRHEMATGPARTESRTMAGPQRHIDRGNDSKRRFGRIPKEVLRQVPVQIDPASGKSRKLCMRYLSQAGCSEDNDGDCPSSHGHSFLRNYPKL
ncbi:hypothetical protein PR001_g2399 [Phytophthora rubi]|uniref:Uncharacterized protein n=1 Tax=Phytophthora rubi TaxID=129364 RepID=A0A6A3P5L9_9STRA|nr:hypothetical protein PR001_g2399 [Phytophthora rubi]